MGLQPLLRSDIARTNFDSNMRLPGFFNPKYTHKPVARIVRLDAGQRYELSAFEKYKPAAEPATAPATVTAEEEEDPIVRAFKERDLYIHEHGSKHLVTCPWAEEHTGQGDATETVLLDDGSGVRGFKCLHAHCNGRRLPDVIKLLGIETRVVVAEPVTPDDEGFMLPIPPNARYGLAHEYATMMSAASGTDYNYWYVSFITSFAASICRRVRLNAFTKRPLRMYSVFIGPKYTGKSQARDMTHAFFEGLRAGDVTIPEIAHYTLIGNANSDAGLLNVAMKHNGSEPSLVLGPDEFSTFLKKCSIQNSSLGQAVGELYEKETFAGWTKDDKHSGTVRVHLTLLSGSTPLEYAAHFDALTAYSGLLSRLWLVAASRPAVRFRVTRPPEPLGLLGMRLKVRDAIHRACFAMRTLELSEPAIAVLRRWCESQEPTEEFTRMQDYIEKLAAINALIRAPGDAGNQGADSVTNQDFITEYDMQAATALGSWELMVRRHYRVEPADSRAARHLLQVRKAIAQALVGRAGAVVSERDLYRALNAHRWHPGSFEASLGYMAQREEIKPATLPRPATGGWTPKAWTLGPAGIDE